MKNRKTAVLLGAAALTAALGLGYGPVSYTHLFISGADMKAKVSGYLKVLYDQNPEAVGGTLPDDAFYDGA